MTRGFRSALVAGVGLLAFLGTGCSHSPKPTAAMESPQAAATAKIYPVLEARIHATQNNHCEGLIMFTREADGSVQVVVDLTGLPPMSQHGIHLHETGDCSAPDAMSAGAHFNPTHQAHGLPPADARHVGDLGNLKADPAGNAHYQLTVTNLSMSSSGNSILGRAVIVHALADDGSQPAGNSGARIGCGVISVPDQGPQN